MSPNVIVLLIKFVITYAAIDYKPPDQNVPIGKDFTIPWRYGNPSDMLTVTWIFISSSGNTTTIMDQLLPSGTPTPRNSFNCVYNNTDNGGITIKNATSANTGTYRIVVAYASISQASDDIIIVEFEECICGFSEGLQIADIISLVLSGVCIVAVIILIILQQCLSWEPPNCVKILDTILVIAIALFALIIGARTVHRDPKCRSCTSNCDISKCGGLYGMGIANIVLFVIDVIVLIVFWLLIMQGKRKHQNEGVKDGASDQEMMSRQNKTSL